ncbi:MAG: sigma factor [Candidatus Weimeria sp.]
MSRKNKDTNNTANTEVIEAHKDYAAGRITANEYFMVIWKILKPQINFEIGLFNRRMNEDYEDLIQEAAIQVLEYLDSYDPERAVPGSYFLRLIRGAHRDLCRNGKSVYYLQKIKKLNLVAQKAGFTGLQDPDLKDVVLASLSGESIQVVKTIREVDLSYGNVDYEEIKDTLEDGYNVSPEKTLIQSERKEEGLEILHRLLDDFEQKLYFEHVGELKSFKEISVELKTDGLYLKFGLKTAPTPSELQRRFSVCDRKLASDKMVASERKARGHYDGYEQGSEEDLLEFLSDSDEDDDDDTEDFTDI